VLKSDVAQNYFALRTLDAERAIRGTRWAFARKRSSWSTPVRKVARPAIWMFSRAGTELNSTEAELLAVDRIVLTSSTRLRYWWETGE